jgi:acylglycerol lipase
VDNLKHIEGSFAGQHNYLIYYQAWLPEKDPKAILLVSHGLAEYGGRYRCLAERFVPLGFGVFALDHQGHGRSQGKPGYVTRFEEYPADLETFCDIVRRKYPDIKIFLLGHSLGGTIAAVHAIRHQDDLGGLVLSGSILKPGESVSWPAILAARLLGRLAPRAGMNIIDADFLSHDKGVVAAYRDDPLVHHGKITYHLGTEILGAMQGILQNMSHIKLPVLIMYGGSDRLCNPAGSEMLFRGISSNDRTIKQYEGLYHEIFNEPERDKVLADLEKWLTRLAVNKQSLPL